MSLFSRLNNKILFLYSKKNLFLQTKHIRLNEKQIKKFSTGCDEYYKSDYFIHRHIGPSEEEKQQMLAKLNFSSLDELISITIPAHIRLKNEMNMDEPLTETELINKLKKIASMNQHEWRTYIGMGYYNCITPSVIQRNIFENPGWITQYTPYQAEIAQGRLESLLNYQTLICDLTGLPVSNASLLDEATAAAEAMQMTFRYYKFKKKNFYVSKYLHPQTMSVIKTRSKGFDLILNEFDESKLEDLNRINYKDTCGILIQYPNTNGELTNLNLLNKYCTENDCMLIFATDPLVLTLIKSPGEYESVQIAVGSAQRLGIPLNYGGPHAAFMATKNNLTRLLPGRVVGVTKDTDGNTALRLALQTREQHIRRDKATSNICTAQALLANMSAMYAIYHGPEGLKKIANQIHLKTVELAESIKKSSSGHELTNSVYFDTLKIKVKNLNLIKERAISKKINLRYFEDGQNVGVSLDETVTKQDLDDLKWIFNANETSAVSYKHILPNHILRTTSYLTHKVFHDHRSETNLLRYMKRLENKDISLVHSMIPLGSCTMKLNGTTELLACSWPEFSKIHPFVPVEQTQGYIKIMRQLEHDLCELTGYNAVSFQPNSGAQGEYAGLCVIKAYLQAKNESYRNVCLIPISAHGTNPASAQMAGFQVEAVFVDKKGRIDINHLKKKLEEHNNKVACLMVTYPSTLGVFEDTIELICSLVHSSGGQIYLDGANMNAQLGLCRPGDYGSDVGHLNLHKTFCIPHGGGGPGMGPIAVKEHLAPFLPNHPVINNNLDQSFGCVSAAPCGSPAILPISWSFIKLMGAQGLKQSSEIAILNANYMTKVLENHYKILYKGDNNTVAHEFIIDLHEIKKSTGVEAIDIAKRLQDYGFHAPTVSWPVPNTLMIEPTESEDKKQLDIFCDSLISIRKEIALIETEKWDKVNNPLKQAPHTQKIVCDDEWKMAYSRKEAAFPSEHIKPETKIWPTARRTDESYGDKNLFCTCYPLEASTN